VKFIPAGGFPREDVDRLFSGFQPLFEEALVKVNEREQPKGQSL